MRCCLVCGGSLERRRREMCAAARIEREAADQLRVVARPLERRPPRRRG
jgi:hypothetical protein